MEVGSYGLLLLTPVTVFMVLFAYLATKKMFKVKFKILFKVLVLSLVLYYINSEALILSLFARREERALGIKGRFFCINKLYSID